MDTGRLRAFLKEPVQRELVNYSAKESDGAANRALSLRWTSLQTRGWQTVCGRCKEVFEMAMHVLCAFGDISISRKLYYVQSVGLLNA